MTNLDIAQSATLQEITEVIKQTGLTPSDYEPLGHYKAKLTQDTVRRLSETRKGKLILVTAVSPTPSGEGK